MRKSLLTLTAIATAITGFATVPAAAQSYRYGDNDRYERDYRGDRYDRREYRRNDRRYDSRYDRRDDRRYDDRRYDDRRYDDSRSYRRCDNGTGGTIIGGVAGALAGREIAGRRGDRTAGAIIGGAVGALAGRAIDRSDSRCR